MKSKTESMQAEHPKSTESLWAMDLYLLLKQMRCRHLSSHTSSALHGSAHCCCRHRAGDVVLRFRWRCFIFQPTKFVLFVLEVFFAVATDLAVWPCFVGTTMPVGVSERFSLISDPTRIPRLTVPGCPTSKRPCCNDCRCMVALGYGFGRV